MSPATHPEFIELAAARLDGPLEPADEQRLARHLAACEPCRVRAAGYEVDRAALRSLRAPTPPRDLWARTSTALDGEQARYTRRAPWPRRMSGAVGPRRGFLGAAVALVAVAVLVASGLFAGFGGPTGPIGLAQATPLDVQPGVLAYVSTRDGQAGVYVGKISKVCPENTTAYCQPIERSVQRVASFASGFVPQLLAVSPDGRAGAVVGVSASGEIVYAIRFPDLVQPAPGESPVATPATTPSGTTQPSQRPTERPGASPATPGASPATPGPSSSTVPTGLATASPGGPEPIIEHVIVVGETPAYSANGSMLAFSAMPADRSSGPDIYVWHVGSRAAVPLTNDHGSIFASWAGASIVGSRAGKRSASGVTPTSFLLDPATGETTLLARPAWRPIVDPTGRFVIFFDGTIAADADGRTWHEQGGGLYLAPWRLFDPNAPATSGATPAPSASAPASSPKATPVQRDTVSPSASATPPDGTAAEAGTEPPSQASPASAEPKSTAPASPGSSGASPAASGSPSPDEPESLFLNRDYDRDPILSWEVRWSPDGGWFGAWIGDNGTSGAGSAETGSLTVAAVDRSSGRVDRERRELNRAPALRAFALGDHRIAWTTLPDPDGTSHVRVLVWTDVGRGVLRTGPGGGSDTLPAF